MINIRPLLEARLRAFVPELTEVAGAAGLASIAKARLSDGGCYLFQERIAASPNGMINATMQRLTETIAVLIVVRNVQDARGGDAADAVFALRALINAALLDWQPDPGADPLEYGGGTLVTFADGFLIWKDSYMTNQYLRAGA
jgi:hypothetical protein